MSAYAFGFGDPCLPTPVRVAPSGPMWWHEIKHDGYRLMGRRTPSGIRIRTRSGYDSRPQEGPMSRAWSLTATDTTSSRGSLHKQQRPTQIVRAARPLLDGTRVLLWMRVWFRSGCERARAAPVQATSERRREPTRCP
jgi:hypothetical protein